MKPGPRLVSGGHLSADDFFALALPSAGPLEGLPAHLSRCSTCSRQFQEWKRAVADLADTAGGPSAGFESDVMNRVRTLPVPRSFRLHRRVLGALSAAAVLVGAFFLGGRFLNPPARPASMAQMSAKDRADDELLRDVSHLVEGEDPSLWKTLAPLPEPGEGNS